MNQDDILLTEEELSIVTDNMLDIEAYYRSGDGNDLDLARARWISELTQRQAKAAQLKLLDMLKKNHFFDATDPYHYMMPKLELDALEKLLGGSK